MTTPHSTNPQDYYLEELSKITSAIVRLFGNAARIFRGEPESYHEKDPYPEDPNCGKVSSALYRKYPRTIDTRNLRALQKETLTDLRTYLPAYNQKEEFEILTELQHYGVETNLVDFTSDYHIALFFACNGSHDKDGRVILLKRTREIDEKYSISKPQIPENRVIAQKSIFVQPPNGYIDLKDICIVTVPAYLKQWILIHLRKFQDLSTTSIFNDLHGFIRNQELVLSPKAIIPRVFAEMAMENLPERNQNNEERRKQLEAAIENYNSGLQYDPYDAPFYTDQARCYFYLGDISRAIETLTKAILLKPDYDFPHFIRGICYSIQDDYQRSITDFETVLTLSTNLAVDARFHRGIELLKLENWHVAETDLITAKTNGKDLAAEFAKWHGSIAAFQSKHGVLIPGNIATMLQPAAPPQIAEESAHG